MFAIHQTDARKSIDDALEAAERAACHGSGCSEGAGPAARVSCLYDLAWAVWELQENVAAQHLRDDQWRRARNVALTVHTAIETEHAGLAPFSRIAEAFGDLYSLLENAAASEPLASPQAKTAAHSGVAWLLCKLREPFCEWRRWGADVETVPERISARSGNVIWLRDLHDDSRGEQS